MKWIRQKKEEEEVWFSGQEKKGRKTSWIYLNKNLIEEDREPGEDDYLDQKSISFFLVWISKENNM